MGKFIRALAFFPWKSTELCREAKIFHLNYFDVTLALYNFLLLFFFINPAMPFMALVIRHIWRAALMESPNATKVKYSSDVSLTFKIKPAMNWEMCLWLVSLSSVSWQLTKSDTDIQHFQRWQSSIRHENPMLTSTPLTRKLNDSIKVSTLTGDWFISPPKDSFQPDYEILLKQYSPTHGKKEITLSALFHFGDDKNEKWL